MRAAPKPKKSISKIRVNVKGAVLSVEDSPFLREEISRTPGWSLSPSSEGGFPLLRKVLAVFPGSSVVALGAPLSSPSSNGLGFICDNLPSVKSPGYGAREEEKLKSRLSPLVNYIEDVKDVQKKFDRMLMKQQGRFVVLYNSETEEKICVPIKSRWNPEGSYTWGVRKKLFAEMDKHKDLSLLSLTFDPSLVEKQMPGWWCESVELWLAVAAGLYLNGFLKKLRKYREKTGSRWNYLGHVLELQENGRVHFHVVFFGSWVAPIAELKSMWGGSDHDAGVDVKGSRGRNHKGLKGYLTKYLTKAIAAIESPGMKSIYALMWRYKVRLWNLSHEMGLKEKRGRGEITDAEYERAKSKWEYCDYCYRRLDDEGLDVYVGEYLKRKEKKNEGSAPFDYGGEYTEEPELEGGC